MSKKDEALKLALEAFEIAAEGGGVDFYAYAQDIREALAEQPAQQQEPYGQVTVVRRPGCVDQHWFYRWPEPPYLDNAAECHTVYTSPQNKPWARLTEGEIRAVRDSFGDEPVMLEALAHAIEAKLREKNA